MVGQNIGAENYGRAKEVAYKSALLLFTLVALGACLVYPIRSSLVDIFADDPEIMAETDRFLQILVPTLPFFGLFMVGMSTGRGSGHTVFPTTVGVFRLWGIRVALGYVLAFNFRMGSIGAWLAISLSNIIGGALALLWIKYGNWTEKVVERKTGV
jgi:Na+-driven multidrug efflux pump